MKSWVGSGYGTTQRHDANEDSITEPNQVILWIAKQGPASPEGLGTMKALQLNVISRF